MADPLYRIYYDGGSVYSGDVWNAPSFGVLVIVERDIDHGRRLVAEKDYYIWDVDNSRWWAVDYMGLIDYLARPGYRKVLFGRTVPNEEWYRVYTRANFDPDFATRSAWGIKERVIDDLT